jgi:hypothetical protein
MTRRLADRISDRWGDTAGTLFEYGVKAGTKYLDAVGEVITEMAFDNMLSKDRGARPMGGGETLVSVMVLSMATQVALKSMGRKGLRNLGGEIVGTPDMAGKVRLALTGVAYGLALSQVIIRLPVMQANTRIGP